MHDSPRTEDNAIDTEPGSYIEPPREHLHCVKKLHEQGPCTLVLPGFSATFSFGGQFDFDALSRLSYKSILASLEHSLSQLRQLILEIPGT